MSMAGSPRSNRTELPVLAVSLVAVGRLGLLISPQGRRSVGVAASPALFQPHAGAYGVARSRRPRCECRFRSSGEPLVNPRMGSLVMPSRWPRGSCWQGWLIADLRGIRTADG